MNECCRQVLGLVKSNTTIHVLSAYNFSRFFMNDGAGEAANVNKTGLSTVGRDG